MRKSKLKKVLKRLKCKDLVEIKWLDACSPGDPSWHNEDEFKEWLNDDFPVTDVGYAMEVSKKYISIVGGFSESEEYVSIYHRELKIPLGCIKSVKLLR